MRVCSNVMTSLTAISLEVIMAGPIVGMLKWVQTSPLAIVSRVRGLYGGWFECQEVLFVLNSIIVIQNI